MKPYRVVLLVVLLPCLALIGQPAARAEARPILDRGWFTRNVNREERPAYVAATIGPTRPESS